MNIKETTLSILHIRTSSEILFNSILAFIGLILGSFKVLCLENVNIFIAVGAVVLFDFFIGVANAINKGKFQTKKALKLVYYLTTYWSLSAVVLLIEKAFPSAFFLSECIIMPLLVFVTISAIKNLSLLGLISNTLLKDILSKIDKHKDD